MPATIAAQRAPVHYLRGAARRDETAELFVDPADEGLLRLVGVRGPGVAERLIERGIDDFTAGIIVATLGLLVTLGAIVGLYGRSTRSS
jgi:hypothetical protein